MILPVGGNDFNLIGLSSDELPTEGVANGAHLHVIDTGEQYIFYDGGWEHDLRLIWALENVL